MKIVQKRERIFRKFYPPTIPHRKILLTQLYHFSKLLLRRQT